jgi:hypothetical protein
MVAQRSATIRSRHLRERHPLRLRLRRTAAGGAREAAQPDRSLQKYPRTNVLLVGHMDAVGSESYNQGLSDFANEELRKEAAKGKPTG